MDSVVKLRLLYLYQYLVNHTDAEHTKSTVQLMKMLKDDYGIHVSRNTISNDFAMLKSSGLKIEHYESTQNKYYYDGQVYNVSELKTIADSVASSKFITQEKSDEILSKLVGLTNEHNVDKLRRYIFADDRALADNDFVERIIDKINEAIDSKKKISFKYTDYDVCKNRYITNVGEDYVLNPQKLVYDGDYYYVRGYCDSRDAMRTFRIDRMYEVPKILDEDSKIVYEPAKDKDRVVFRMFDTDEVSDVELYCDASMMRHVIDKFGINANTEAIDEQHFVLKAKVCPSQTFYRWIFGYGDKVRILGPKTLKDEYVKQIEAMLRYYYFEPDPDLTKAEPKNITKTVIKEPEIEKEEIPVKKKRGRKPKVRE